LYNGVSYHETPSYHLLPEGANLLSDYPTI
jgi:hypothetical protein